MSRSSLDFDTEKPSGLNTDDGNSNATRDLSDGLGAEPVEETITSREMLVDAGYLSNGNCAEILAARDPDLFVQNWPGSGPLAILFVPTENEDHNAAIVVIDPDGSPHCERADADEPHPTVVFPESQAGNYPSLLAAMDTPGQRQGPVLAE